MAMLTRTRVLTAYAVAAAVDVLQILGGPLGWVFVDQALDVVAALLMWRLLGFHPLLLPTFVVEFLPVADLLPTWTGCVAVVVALRKRQQTMEIDSLPTRLL
jgi:hypothetical protein